MRLDVVLSTWAGADSLSIEAEDGMFLERGLGFRSHLLFICLESATRVIGQFMSWNG